MNIYESIAFDNVIARKTRGGQILLISPSDQTEAGHYIPADEIYLKPEVLEKIYTVFCKGDSQNG